MRGPIMLTVLSLPLLTLCAPVPASAADSGGFRELRRTKDGIVISSRPGRSKGFFVTRFDTRSKQAPASLAERLWKGFLKHEPPVVERRFIKRDKDELVFYDKVRTPVVSDRDYTMRITRTVDAGVHRIRFRTAPEFDPPPDPKYVRMPLVEGFWEVSPSADGGSVVRYEVYSEPGGSVPAFIIKEPQVNEALKDFRRAIGDSGAGAK